jgi:hypothetical protein
MLRDYGAIYNKLRGLIVRFVGFINSQKKSSTGGTAGSSVDRAVARCRHRARRALRAFEAHR